MSVLRLRPTCLDVLRSALAAALIGGALAPATPACAQYRAVAAAPGAIQLDGRLDEPVWAAAPVHDQFIQYNPYTGQLAPTRTTVRVAYDMQALYVAIHAHDPQAALIRAPLVRFDKVFRDQDFVVVYVDAIGTRAAAQFFRVNAAGGMADGVHSAATDNEDFSPDFSWDSAARITDDGYIVEMRLPYASLRFAHEGTRRWRMQVARRMPREQTWLFIGAPLTRESSSFIDELLPLEDFPGPRGEASLQVMPTLTARRTREEPDDLRTRSTEVQGSLDVKWRPRADWVIDGTINPDFSQIELDLPQLARTRQFALFLQEKRPFFLEGSDLNQTSTTALYTRAITDPRWGARATYRGDSLATSVLSAADRGGGLVLLPQPYATGFAVQPASQASTARLRWADAGFAVGAIAADRQYADGRGYNRVAGPDLAWQLTRQQFVRAQLLASSTTAFADTNGQLQAGSAREGHLASLDWFLNRDDASFNLRYLEASDDFRNDNGFVAQNDFRQWRGFIAPHFRPAGQPFGINEISPTLEFEHAQTRTDGATITQTIHPGVAITGPRGVDLTLQYRPHERARLAPGGVLHDYQQWYLFLSATPAAVLTLLTLEATAGERVDVVFDRVRPGTLLSVSGRIRLGARIEMEPRFDQVRLQADNGAVAQRETAAQLLTVLHLSARDTLRLIVQRTAFRITADAAPAATPVDDEATTGSLVYAHRRSAATVVYLGVGRGRERTPTRVARADEVFVKLQVGL